MVNVQISSQLAVHFFANYQFASIKKTIISTIIDHIIAPLLNQTTSKSASTYVKRSVVSTREHVSRKSSVVSRAIFQVFPEKRGGAIRTVAFWWRDRVETWGQNDR